MGVIDIAKFQKNLSKSMDTISIGFSNPDTWIDSGNFGLNFRISGNFKKGFPLEGKMTVLAGESGSGKSYISSGHVVKWCQQNGILPIIIDTENALDEDWVRALGVDPNGYVVKVKASLIDDIAKIMADFIKDYKSQYGSVVYNEKPRVLFIIDSLGMAITPTESDQFEKGDMKGDLGRKQKQLYSLCRNFLNSCGSEPIGLLCTQHTYASQDIFSPDAVIAGGSSVQFTPSIVIAMNKRKLKEDEEGNKTTEVQGIKVDAVVRKTRYAKPYQKISFNIPWDRGLDEYSGLFELFSESLEYNGKPVLQRDGNKYAYYSLKTGELVFSKFRKAIEHSDYDIIMNDFQEYYDSNDKSVEQILDEATEKTK